MGDAQQPGAAAPVICRLVVYMVGKGEGGRPLFSCLFEKGCVVRRGVGDAAPYERTPEPTMLYGGASVR